MSTDGSTTTEVTTKPARVYLVLGQRMRLGDYWIRPVKWSGKQVTLEVEAVIEIDRSSVLADNDAT